MNLTLLVLLPPKQRLLRIESELDDHTRRFGHRQIISEHVNHEFRVCTDLTRMFKGRLVVSICCHNGLQEANCASMDSAQGFAELRVSCHVVDALDSRANQTVMQAVPKIRISSRRLDHKVCYGGRNFLDPVVVLHKTASCNGIVII